MDSSERLVSIFREGIPVFLAPMAGVTDAPFRRIVKQFGVTAVVSEMVSSEALVRNNYKTRKRLVADENDIKIIQIMGHDPEKMAESARINEDVGADIIDINMGCPVKKIVNNNAGAALMKDESTAVKIAEAVVKAVKIPVTVKMRLGWDSDNKNFKSLAARLESVGVQMLTVHCRTRAQMYSGRADWRELAELRECVKIPYLCNGDITTAAEAEEALKQSNADGVMIGRGALGKPWRPNQIMRGLNNHEAIADPSLEEQYQTVMQHFRDTVEFYARYLPAEYAAKSERELFGLKIFRKHFCWYSAGMSGAAAFREQINKVESVKKAESLVKDFYSSHISLVKNL